MKNDFFTVQEAYKINFFTIIHSSELKLFT